MLRTLAAALLLANLLFFAWAQGWFGALPRASEREPERVAAQVRPESVTVLPAKAASAAVSAARAAAAVCLEAGPFIETGIAAAEAALAPAQLAEGRWARESVWPPPAWLVYTGSVADAASRRAREAELRKYKLAFETLDSPAALAPGLVLSRHATQAQAEAALAALAGQTIKGLRVVALPAPPPQLWLRVAHADGPTQARLRALPGAALAGGFRPCAARPPPG
ncbi:MAG: hypothetical protein Q8K96_01845 [Rubrivivax sp.]|nr:hypothetical protein [Rubrivivax sp.]